MKKFIYVTLLLLTSQNIQAIPLGDVFTYQGELMEAGVPANGVYTFNVYFYDTQSGGNLITTQPNLTVPVNNGLFNMKLDITSFPFQGEEVWIELEIVIIIRGVGANEILSPRQLITTTPYAIQAYFVSAGGVNSDAIQNEAITSNKLANGSVTHSKMDVNSINGSNIINGTITADDINNSSIQQRITGTCPQGESIREISSAGTVTCELDDSGGGPIDWRLNGNAGTASGIHFIGTTDNQSLEFKVNNITALKLSPTNNNGSSKPNIMIGDSSNTINSFSVGSVIGGGAGNAINTGSNSEYNVIAGGDGNQMIGSNGIYNQTISGGFANKTSASFATVAGGRNNTASGENSFVAGGESNISSAENSFSAGKFNQAGGERSFALGFLAHVRNPLEAGNSTGDTGTFIWSHSGLTSTDSNQFLVEAENGYGIGTNTPLAPLHVIGRGVQYGLDRFSKEVVMMIENTYPNDINFDSVGAAIQIDRPTGKDASVIFSKDNVKQYEIRSKRTSNDLQINHYDSDGHTDPLMSLSESSIQVHSTLNPGTADGTDIGQANFRWNKIYLFNGVDVLSDRRLKANINEINYGLKEILAMRPVSYNWKKDANSKYMLGLIAQDVEKLIPEVVNQADDEQKTRSMQYSELIPVLIKGMQEQQQRIEQQDDKIQQLQDLVTSLVNNN